MGHHSLRAVLAILLCALVLASPTVPAQARPKLADYFTEIPETGLDPGYSSVGGFGVQTAYLDFNADGQQDLLVLGYDTPASGLPFTGQLRPGRLFVGDGNGHFTPASPPRYGAAGPSPALLSAPRSGRMEQSLQM